MNPQNEPAREELLYSKLKWGRVKTPTVIQMEAAECGAAALSILLSYYGRYVPLEQLRYQCGVSRDGCNAFNLVEAAKLYGLDAEGFQLSLEDLNKLPLPYIAFWQGNHFVVVEGYGKNGVYLNDPATGPRHIPFQNFVKNFSLMTITAAPSSSFKKEGSPPQLLSMLAERLPAIQSSTLIFLILLQLIMVIIALVPPAISRVFIDHILGGGMLSWKWGLIGIMGFVLAIQLATGFIQGTVLNKLGRRLSICFSIDFLWHILRLPVLFFSQRFGGEIVSRMVLNNSISNILTGQISVTVVHLFLIAIYGILIVQYDLAIAGVALATTIGNFLVFKWISRLRSNAYCKLQQENARQTAITIDTLQSIESIKLLGTESFSFSKIAGLKASIINELQQIGLKDAWLMTLSSLFQQLSSLSLLGIGSLRMMSGDLTVGMYLALQMLLSSFLGPIQQLLGFGLQIQKLRIDFMRVNDVLKNPLIAGHEERSGDEKEEKLLGSIVIKDLTFGYSPLDEPLIKRFNLEIKSGQRVAFVGPSGSGKSTLAKIICGLYQPWEGDVHYDDLPFKKLSRKQLSTGLAWVDQDLFFFGGTIKDNLTLWNSQISDEDIIRAAKDADAHDFIMEKEGGYNARMSEGGSDFSQGQKQRLEIARALLVNPSILVLDEATSALDSLSEARILQNISRRNCTCIAVAHRLSTVKNFDTIVVLQEGVEVQRGTHDELKGASGLYQQLLAIEGV